VLALLDQEEAEAAPAAVLVRVLAAGQHQDDVAAAVGDEALGAGDRPLPVTGSCMASMPPALVCTLARSLPASGSVRAMAPVSSPVAMPGRYFALSSSLPNCVDGRRDAALQAEEVHQRRVGAGDDLDGGGVEGLGEGSARRSGWGGEAHELGLAQVLEVALQPLGKDHLAILELAADVVHIPGARGDALGGQVEPIGSASMDR
jgi:hypothetical protein